jgi:hypothetical protein
VVFLNWEAVEAVSPERILIAAAIIMEFQRGKRNRRVAGEDPTVLSVLGSWVQSLEQGSYTRQDLQTMAAGLDLLREHRIRMIDRLTADFYHEAAGQIKNVDDPSRTMMPAPGWRHLKSRRLYVTGVLKEIREALVVLNSLEPLPVWARIDHPALKSLSDRLDTTGVHVGIRYWQDSLDEAFVDVLRIATALARHRAESGSWPPTLEALVPRYLPAIPRCASSGGKPYPYSNGVLSFEFMEITQPVIVRPGVE